MANNFDLQIKWLNGSQVEIQANDGEALTGDEIVLVMQNDTPKETTTQAIANLGGGGGSSYLVYTALLSQTGTDAPVATVLENTLGGTVVWSRAGSGQYYGTLTGVFLDGKTFCLSDVNQDFSTLISNTGRSTSDIVIAYITDYDGVFVDLEGRMQVEIRVYPV